MNSLLTNAILSLPLVGAFSMFAVGIVVIYRASNVLNLAHGAMAALPAYVAFGLVNSGMPKLVAFILAVGAGAVLGIVVEGAVLKPLRSESQTTQTVATVAILGVIIAGIALIWGTAPQPAPNMFPEGGLPVGFTDLEYSGIGLFVVASIAAAILALIFQKTSIGLMMRAAADNPRAAVLMGIDPNKTTRIAWAMGGALAGAAGVLLAGATILHPYTLARQVLPAFVAALLGGLGNIYGALAGSVVVGLTQGVVSSIGPLADRSGSSQLVLAIMAMIVLAARGKALVGTTESRGGGGTRAGTRRLKVTKLKLLFAAAIAPIVIAWPFLPVPPWLLADANLAAIFTMVGVSLVILTGWVGQISLSQAAFVGVSAFVTGLMTNKAGIHFPLNLPIAAAASALVASALGFVALRVRGLYLAVATLIFGWMADEFLFKSEWLVGAGGSSTITSRVIGRPSAMPSFDLTDRRTFWFVAFAGALVAIAAAANLRDSKIGRAFFAIRGSEMAAASLGIDVVKTKLAAFAASGVLAGLAGNLIMVDQRTATPAQFSFSSSLFFLSMAVIGGTGSLAGVTASAIFFAALSGVAETIPSLGRFLELFSTTLLLVAVLLSPASRRARAWALIRRMLSPVRGRIGSKAPVPSVEPRSEPAKGEMPKAPVADSHAASPAVPPVPLSVENVTVRFGGLVASSDVSIRVESGQIVGLIGPNGAGKTTIFNAISGFVRPTEGKVVLFGQDVTNAPVHERSALGLGRTFQALQLFNDATVFENLMVATHLQMKTNMISHLFITEKALRSEHRAESEVREVIALAGLDDVASRRAGDLPFGILRMVEVARAMVTGASLIMLDEPASGLDDRETDALGSLLLKIREEMGRSLLLVEHDVRFVTELSDHLFVLDRGTIISSGPAAEVRDDPVVIAAYLGDADQELEEVGA